VATLSLSILLHVSVLAAGGHNYADAYHQTASTGRPLVILVGADWCPGCQRMKNTVIPQLQRQGSLNRVAFAYVNSDGERDLARKLMSGGSIPQLIMFRKTAKGWQREQLTGAQSVGDTQVFLSRGENTSPTKLTSR
jgi:thiol-disulfide isomerase/thioredoxin